MRWAPTNRNQARWQLFKTFASKCALGLASSACVASPRRLSLEREVVDQTAARTLTETRASWRAGRPSGALASNTHWPIPGKKAPNMRKREPDGTQISFTIIPLAQTSLVLSVLFSLEAGRRVAYRGEETGPYGLSPTECVPCASLQSISLDKTHTHTHDWWYDFYIIAFLYYFITLYFCTRPLKMTVNSVKSANDTVS